MAEGLQKKVRIDSNTIAIVADAVDRYEGIIKPALERRDFDGARIIITDLVLRSQQVPGISLYPKEEIGSKNKVTPYYRRIISHLSWLVSEKFAECADTRTREKEVSSVLPLVGKAVEKLDQILGENEVYKRNRQLVY